MFSVQEEIRKRLSIPPRPPGEFPIKDVISLHLQFSGPKILPANIGDGFLYATNPVYKNIRDEYLQRGFCFTTKDFCHYFDFPMMCLDDLIAAGKIPVRKNFAWLEILEKSAPGKFTLYDLWQTSPTFNYLFHESAHLIAHDIIFGKLPMNKLPKNSDSLLKIILGEAFANSMELIGSVFGLRGIGAYFLYANSYIFPPPHIVVALRKASEQLDFAPLIKVLMASFLYSNFLYENFTGKELDLIRSFSGAKKKADIESLAKHGLHLNKNFRMQTTPMYLKKVGITANFEKLIKFDPLERLLQKRNQHLLEKVELLVNVICPPAAHS